MADRPAPTVNDPLEGTADGYALDHATWASLTGHHRHLAEIRGQAARYPVDVSPFVAIAPDHDDSVWDDLVGLVGPGGTLALAGSGGTPPPAEWEVVGEGAGVQMIGGGLHVVADPEAVQLGIDDVPEMLELIGRTRPGPFLPRTVEMGRYVGIRDGGRLVAMAGERLHPPGWTEISAVYTDSAYRGHGLATRLVRTVGAGIKARGETPFLHAAAANVNAIRLYEQLGFVVRRRPTFLFLRAPGGAQAG